MSNRRATLLLSSCFIPASLGSDANPFRSFALTAGLEQASPLVFLSLEGGERGIGSQIATKMAGDTVLREVEQQLTAQAAEESFDAELLVQGAFKSANAEVYRYAHTMGAGGQIAAKAIVAIFDGSKFTVGQVGNYESLLFRDGELLRFFEPIESGGASQGAFLDRFVGANAKVLVDLVSLRVQEGDLIVLSTTLAKTRFYEESKKLFADPPENLASCAPELGKILLATEADDRDASAFQNHQIFLAKVIEQ